MSALKIPTVSKKNHGYTLIKYSKVRWSEPLILELLPHVGPTMYSDYTHVWHSNPNFLLNCQSTRLGYGHITQTKHKI